jgi:cytosine/adenosine deaminase-related metal-dependent hydrolase
LLKQLVDVAKRRKLPVAMHIAESHEEIAFLDKGVGPFQELLDERSMWDAASVPRGSRPLNYLRTLAEAPRVLVIHGNYLVDDEREFLAQHRQQMSLVYCPRTHAYFCHPKYPLVESLQKGVRVALGTDSRASNPDLSVLAEMRQVAKDYPEIDPQEVLRMGTLSGAEALRRSDHIGSIAVNKVANVVAVPLEDSSLPGPEILEALLAGDAAPSAVWLNGRRL